MCTPVPARLPAVLQRLGELGPKVRPRLLLAQIEHQRLPKVLQVVDGGHLGNARGEHHREEADDEVSPPTDDQKGLLAHRLEADEAFGVFVLRNYVHHVVRQHERHTLTADAKLFLEKEKNECEESNSNNVINNV